MLSYVQLAVELKQLKVIQKDQQKHVHLLNANEDVKGLY